MRQRGTVGRKPAKMQQRKPTRPKRINAAMAAGQASSTIANLQEQVSALTRELAEASAYFADIVATARAVNDVVTS